MNWRPDSRFVIGLIMIGVMSFITGILGPGVLYLFGIPLFLLLFGLILVWLSKAPLKPKAIATVLPIPLIISVFFLSIWFRTASPELYLIPDDFRGEFVVYFDEPCGSTPIYDGKSRIFRVPSNGVLITQASESHGYLNHRFESIDSDGNRKILPEFRRQNFETEQKEWNMYGTNPAGELTRDTVGAFWSYGTETYHISKQSRSWLILSYRDFESDHKDLAINRKLIANEAERILSDCRTNAGN